MATESMTRPADEILQNISRNVNGLGEENRNTRKRAMEAIRKEIMTRKPALESEVLQDILSEIIKPVLKLASDPVEKCRELSVNFLKDSISKCSSPHEFLSFIIPVLVQRLGQQDIIETSEEIRLMSVEFLIDLITLSQKRIAAYLDDLIKILQRTIVDPYPEVKKQSCKCASSLAKAIPEHFHMQSASLINPLLQSVTHQHSRVRVEAILAIGDVCQYGSGKSVDDVVSHLAQRLFDQAPAVRAVVTTVVGNWLLDLMDRYSYFHKLIPLLLTSITDEVPEIREQAEALWNDAGLKFERENEQDLKDKQDFMKPDLEHYPPGVERPNLGCRELIYRNFSKIFSGLSKDLFDWVAATRIKSAQLLYVLVLNDEENITQHLDKLLSTLYKACGDEEKEVIHYVVKTSEFIGYFVEPEIWCKLVLGALKVQQSVGCLMVLAGIVRGSQRALLKPHLADIVNIIADPGIARLSDMALQREVLSVIESLMTASQEDCTLIAQDLFNILMSVLALNRAEDIQIQTSELIETLASLLGYSSTAELYQQHTLSLVEHLKADHTMWTKHSVDRLIFDTLLINCGPVAGDILEDIIPMFVVNLNPEKDPEVRLSFFALLSRLMLKTRDTLDSRQRFGEFAVTVVKDMVVPNLVWKAGRTAAAIRTTAVSCLWALLQSELLPTQPDKLSEVNESVMTQLRSVMDDDNQQTRLISCRVMTRWLRLAGESLDKDRLHTIYPDLLKRLDDGSDDVRVATSKTFIAYFECFTGTGGFEPGLYRAHLEDIYKGLLIHLDDPEQRIQEAVLEVLQKAGEYCPSLLLEQVEKVRFKHRSTQYLDQLSKYLHNLPKNA